MLQIANFLQKVVANPYRVTDSMHGKISTMGRLCAKIKGKYRFYV